MKKSLSLVFIFFSFLIYSQNQNRFRFHHVFKSSQVENSKVKQSNGFQKIYGQPSTGKMVSKRIIILYRTPDGKKSKELFLCSKRLKGIISMNNNVPVIDFWQIKPNMDCCKSDTTCISSNTSTKDYRFEIDLSPRNSLGESTYMVKVPFRSLNFGLGSVPLRARLPLDTLPLVLTANVNFIFNAGYTWGKSFISTRGMTNYSATFGTFIGCSPVDLKKNAYKDAKKYKYDQTNIGLSYGLNVILARNNFGAVISFGWDTAMGNNSDFWIYQNKPWFGIGFNTSLGMF